MRCVDAVIKIKEIMIPMSAGTLGNTANNNESVTLESTIIT
jgi:hypothetical protein